jgi:hypothetical protein
MTNVIEHGMRVVTMEAAEDVAPAEYVALNDEGKAIPWCKGVTYFTTLSEMPPSTPSWVKVIGVSISPAKCGETVMVMVMGGEVKIREP